LRAPATIFEIPGTIRRRNGADQVANSRKPFTVVTSTAQGRLVEAVGRETGPCSDLALVTTLREPPRSQFSAGRAL